MNASTDQFMKEINELYSEFLNNGTSEEIMIRKMSEALSREIDRQVIQSVLPKLKTEYMQNYTIPVPRGVGNTTVLIGAMLQNPNIRMVVKTHDYARQLSKIHGINIKRFITVDDLHLACMGLNAPLVFDIPAIEHMVQLAIELAVEATKKEMENLCDKE